MKRMKCFLVMLLVCSGTVQTMSDEHNEETPSAESTRRPKKHNRFKVLFTTALVPPDKDRHQGISRQNEYINALGFLRRYGCETYVVESIASGPTFLDQYADHVCYTHSNDSSLKNHGINECVAMRIGLQQFNFDPEDMIIKLTGRYALRTDEFIQLLKNNPNADAVLKPWSETNAYTAVFAMKAKYFEDFLNNYINYEWWKSDEYQTVIGEEELFGRYITKMRKEGAHIVHIPRLYNYFPLAGIPESCR